MNEQINCGKVFVNDRGEIIGLMYVEVSLARADIPISSGSFFRLGAYEALGKKWVYRDNLIETKGDSMIDPNNNIFQTVESQPPL